MENGYKRPPTLGRACQNIHWGRFTSPYPLRPGHPATKVSTQFVYSHSIRKMGAKFGSNRKILPRGDPCQLWGQLKFKRIGSQLLVLNQAWRPPSRTEGLLDVEEDILDVQKALRTYRSPPGRTESFLDVQKTLLETGLEAPNP